MKLNLGCGTIKLPGFINVDHRADSNPELVDDAFTLTTVKNSSVDEIVAAHLLEHACFDRTKDVLFRWFCTLKTGGRLWLAVPDFQLVMTQHLADLDSGAITWEYFCSRIFGNLQVAKQMYGRAPLTDIQGIARYEATLHKAVFTPKMLAALLVQVGFIRVKQLAKLPMKFKHPHEFCMTGVRP